MLELRVNGHSYELDAAVGRTLAEALRNDLGLTGTKIACAEGHCGACTVQLDGVPVLSCITLVHTVGEREVTTIEGLREHPLVEAFVEADATQCGFCTPGQIVSAAALLAATPRPGHDEIVHAMSGNLCRCGTYLKIERAIAAVAADTVAQARAAVEAIDVEWEVLEPLLDAEQALAQKSFVTNPRDYERGDVERGLAEADAVVEAEYRTQSVLHNALETHQSACEWEGDTLVVYTSTQFLWGVRDEVAEAFALPKDKVRVICRFMGGGFGAKGSAGDYTMIAAELAKRTGRPVHCRLDRREENVNSGNRNPTIQKLRLGARSDGTLTAIDAEYECLLGWDGWLPPTAGPAQMLYACQNLRTVERGVRLNAPPMDAFRAPGFVEGTFGLECALDELAAKLDLDPLEVRRRNHADHDPMDERPFSAKELMECYRRAAPPWERRQAVRARCEGPA